MLSQDQIEIMQEKGLTRYLDRVEKSSDDYVKIFGEFEAEIKRKTRKDE